MWRTALSPRWAGLLVLAVAIAAVMSLLGVWQLQVYQDKTSAATERRAAAPPVPLDSLFSIDEGLPEKAVGRRVTVSGSWAPAGDQIFVSGRQHGDRDGFWVVTPLLLDGDAGAVLVVRGWAAAPDEPTAAVRPGRVTVTGTVLGSEAEDSSAAASRGRVLPSLRLPTIVGMVGYRLYDAFVLLATVVPPSSTAPATVDPPPPPKDHAGLRNIAYAVQWWIFAAFVLFMWCRMVVDAHRDRESAPAGTVSA